MNTCHLRRSNDVFRSVCLCSTEVWTRNRETNTDRLLLLKTRSLKNTAVSVRAGRLPAANKKRIYLIKLAIQRRAQELGNRDSTSHKKDARLSPPTRELACEVRYAQTANIFAAPPPIINGKWKSARHNWNTHFKSALQIRTNGVPSIYIKREVVGIRLFN